MSTLSLRGAPRLKTYDLPGVIVLACVVMVVGALANGVGCLCAGPHALEPRERQALVWRALETDLSRDDHMRVCVVLALTPKEDEAKS